MSIAGPAINIASRHHNNRAAVNILERRTLTVSCPPPLASLSRSLSFYSNGALSPHSLSLSAGRFGVSEVRPGK